MEALQCAQKGHLWGPAIVIASLLGEQVLKNETSYFCQLLVLKELILICLKFFDE